jgi:NADPH:quinone reductase-like Zn-dependent oxidoreductase
MAYGDRVCALVSGGGCAEYCVAPAVQCLPIPGSMTVVSAAAIPETFFTVWTNLFRRGGLQPGERVLIHGGSSGIGTTAIQLAHASESIVFATAGSDAKCEACRRLGADVAVNYRNRDFVEVVRRETSGAGVDVILTSWVAIISSAISTASHWAAVWSRLACSAAVYAQVDLGRIMRRRLTVTGSTLRVRTVEEKGELARDLEANVWPLLVSGRVGPVIDRTFPLRMPRVPTGEWRRASTSGRSSSRSPEGG